MAKGSMKGFWNDRQREGDRLKRLAARKKQPGAVNDSEAGAESSAGLKPEEPAEKEQK